MFFTPAIAARGAGADRWNADPVFGIADPGTPAFKIYPHNVGGQRQRVIDRDWRLAQRAGSLDCGRADTRSTYRAGADLARLPKFGALGHETFEFITHDSARAPHRRRSLRVAYGKIVEQGPVEQVFRAEKHAYTRAIGRRGAETRTRRPTRRNAGREVADNFKRGVADKRGLLRSHVGHNKGGGGGSASRVARARTLGVVGRIRFGKTTWVLTCCA